MKQWVEGWIAELARTDMNTGLAQCPFAKKAWDQGAVNVVHTDDLWKSVHEAVQNFGKYKVVMCIQEEMDQEYEALELECSALNRWFAFNKQDIWLLASHKDYCTVLVQRLSELDSASVALEKQGYYAEYEQRDYDRLILQRRVLRQSVV